jgi:prepilin-type N-terminal cleavage/methylation domain-containing protein/prepilin-type processing-associated H-X9-DG protein
MRPVRFRGQRRRALTFIELPAVSRWKREAFTLVELPAVVSRRKRAAFTLVELLVVIGIIAILLAILLPALSRSRREAHRANCLANLRSMQVAQWIYATENRGYLIQAGLGHGGAHANEPVAWFNTLQRYGSNKLLPRCPADNSPHWPGGAPVPNSGGQQYRRTSYGINDFLDREMCPWGPNFSAVPLGGLYVKINQVRRPAATVQFIEMTYTGPFAGADHPHVENWAGVNVPASAARHVRINAHGRDAQPADWQSLANYGFLDGHAESLRFRDVFTSFQQNRFDPAVAR